MKILLLVVLVFWGLIPLDSLASIGGAGGTTINLTASWFGFASLLVFIIAYIFVIAEEFTHCRKSKPVGIAAGIIWALIGVAYLLMGGQTSILSIEFSRIFLEYSELAFFLLVAMTFINTLKERGVFDVIRVKMIERGFSLRSIFWLTGIFAFLISPIADNLTTALVMCAIVMAVSNDKKFVTISLINIVVAANAGGAFSPFGDITTLMIWQSGNVEFTDFFVLLLPSLVNWIIPALFMSLSIENKKVNPIEGSVELKDYWWLVALLFLLTITTAVLFHNFLGLPAVIGMMFGLSILKTLGYFIKMQEQGDSDLSLNKKEGKRFDIFISIKNVEWDTLLFFYGVMLCVGGLGVIGYLSITSEVLYETMGPTFANILVGMFSAIIDNIPVMYAVLTMSPDMSLGQWLLVTLTAGVGGSLLSIGSAAGVALMGQAKGFYSFFGHLRWSWAIGLGYAASIFVHFIINAKLF